MAVVTALALATASRADPDVSCSEGVSAEAQLRFDDAANGYLACAERAASPGEVAWGRSRAARVLATKLFRFDEALTLLDRLSAEFPTDPRAIAAQGLAMVIRQGRAAGDEPLRLYYTLLERPDLLPRSERIPTLRRMLTEYPSFPMVDTVMRMLAIELRGEGDYPGALAALTAMRERFAGQPAAATAVLETGATYFAAGRFTESAAWYRRLGEFGGSAALGEQSARRALAHRARQRIAWLAIGSLATWAAWVVGAMSWRSIDRTTLGNASREILVLAPTWLVLVVVSLGTSPGIHRPIWWIGGATALILVLSNLCLLTRHPGRRARWLHGLLTVGSVVAIVYLSFYRYDLVFTLEETLRYGPGVG